MELKKPPLYKGEFFKTLNKMGCMMRWEDPYRRDFIKYCRIVDKPVLDVGAAYGIVSIQALKSGAKVISNDMDERHLKILEKEAPKKYRKNLHLCPGRFPQELDFEEGSLSGIYISQVFHFLKGEDIQEGLRKAYRWLDKRGKIFIITLSPYTIVI